MANNYITKYICPLCEEVCNTSTDADNHCPIIVDEVYECEKCGYTSSDHTEIRECCSK